MVERIYTVTEFNRILKISLEENEFFREIFIKGEISNITYYKSGHLYFSLKDRESQIKCVAFNYKMKRILADLKEGDSVKVFCDMGVYEARGEIQALVRHVERESELGELFKKLELLKESMKIKGYFNPEHKRKLPKYPRNIGIVTSYTGAALQDMIKTLRKRDNRINIYVYGAKVQGSGSTDEIVKGIEVLNKISEIDFIVAGRGGGSIEDLWSFNNEKVAMAFYNSKKPIISAVGHETDILLSDFTADIRASTPTQAMEIGIPEKKELRRKMAEIEKNLTKIMFLKLKNCEKELERVRGNYFIRNYNRELEKYANELMTVEANIKREVEKIIARKKTDLQLRIERIISLNPMKILESGYSITEFKGKNLKNISEIKPGNEVTIKLKSGAFKASVKEIVKC
ncbi:MAG: exodeoxyribonuclease VII large subunit [Fusobacteriaceae bacterium]